MRSGNRRYFINICARSWPTGEFGGLCCCSAIAIFIFRFFGGGQLEISRHPVQTLSQHAICLTSSSSSRCLPPPPSMTFIKARVIRTSASCLATGGSTSSFCHHSGKLECMFLSSTMIWTCFPPMTITSRQCVISRDVCSSRIRRDVRGAES